MQIELLSRTKMRDGGRVADDVVLLVPGLVAAVFDGATDPTGSSYDGRSSGWIAASSAARRLGQIAIERSCERSLEELVADLSTAIARASADIDAVHPPSTTMAAAIWVPGGWRLMIVGDSGIRVNGETVLRHEKLIDEVSTLSRLAVRRCLEARGLTGDGLEAACRAVSYRGLARALERGDLDAGDAERIRGEVVAAVCERAGHEDVIRFLDGGIVIQQGFANGDADHPLGFATLNGSTPKGFGMSDRLVSESEVETLELFTDGYFALPKGRRVEDWERRFAEVEREDPSKTGPYANVKGSTGEEFSDDRSVICLWR